MTTLKQTTAPASSETRTLTVRYFAWVREKVGTAEETLAVPLTIKTVAELIEWLKARGENYEAAFERAEIIRTALDQIHARPDAAIAGAEEVAFFPPVTGG